MGAAATLRAATSSDVCKAVREAIAHGEVLEVRGGGSKAAISAPCRGATVIDVSAFSGVIDYDPSELVLTVAAGTPLMEVESLVAGENQMLAFEPFDHGPIFGKPVGAATIGGVIAAGVSGSRRLSAGGARDHLLGFHAVSGRGEAFVAGGKVVKNVTGYDLCKLMVGSWGRLAVLTEVTLKVLPRPRTRLTLAVRGLDDRAAVAAMARAMRSQAEVVAAAHLPGAEAYASTTALRLEGFEASVTARSAMLRDLFGDLGGVETLDGSAAEDLWRRVREAAPLADGEVLWRINTPPSAGPDVTAALAPHGARWFYDWAGGLVWLTLPAGTAGGLVRQAAAAAGGHATLVRADAEVRAKTPILQPEVVGVAALSRRLKETFDPAGVLDPDRFGGRRAD